MSSHAMLRLAVDSLGRMEDSMSDIAARYARVADDFADRVRAVAPEAWEHPSPCEGWVARDVVRHLTDWLPAFFGSTWGLSAPEVPPVDDDPLASWQAVDATLR